jgi:hypothetical protein
MGLREEIANKIQSAEVRNFDNLVFAKDIVYLKEFPATKLRYGYETIMEMIVVTEEQDSNLYEILKSEIGTRGVYGDYKIQLISYSVESSVLALDNFWTRRVSMKITWEG